MNFNTLYAAARRNEVQLKVRESFDGMVDGFSKNEGEWHYATVEELKKIREEGGHVNTDGDTIYSYCDTFRLKFEY